MLCSPAMIVRKANGHSFQTATTTSDVKALAPSSQNGRSDMRWRLSTSRWFTSPVSRWSMKFQVRIPA